MGHPFLVARPLLISPSTEAVVVHQVRLGRRGLLPVRDRSVRKHSQSNRHNSSQAKTQVDFNRLLFVQATAIGAIEKRSSHPFAGYRAAIPAEARMA